VTSSHTPRPRNIPAQGGTTSSFLWTLLPLALQLVACGPQDNTGDSLQVFVEERDDGQVGTGTEEDPYASLQDAIDASEDGATIHIANGRYEAEVREFIDPTCGNCDDTNFRDDVNVTVGFHVHGKSLHLRGESRDGSILDTGAGYGVLFEEAGQSSVTGLTVTGGRRDADGRATNAAIVVRYTDLLVRDVDVVENNHLYEPAPGEDDPVAGVMGITGREGSRLTVVGCRIEDNSWDGIALYRSDPEVEDSSPSAVIVDNIIGCTTDCVQPNGRGAGIGITWDAEAEIINNEIHHYWKGIGSFGNSEVVATNNVVRDQVGWGVIASGESTMHAVNNLIINNGTTGLAAWNLGASGAFVNNIITGNGWSADEWVGKKTGVWMNAPDDFEFSHNNVWNNSNFDVCSGGTPGSTPCTNIHFDGVDGNLSVDPQFADTDNYALADGSPMIDAGDPEILDLDGSTSDLGVHGGPEAGREEP